MRKEFYLDRPPAVELYDVNTGTDIILRKNISQTEREDKHDGEVTKSTVWECEEVQYRHKGKVAEQAVTEKFDYWWAIAEGKDEIDATDEQAKKDGTPTVMERLEALESGIVELAEVLCNG